MENHTTNSTTFSFEITGLKLYTSYEVRVTGFTSKGSGNYSAWQGATCRTLQGGKNKSTWTNCGLLWLAKHDLLRSGARTSMQKSIIVEQVLINGSETWTLTSKQQRSLHGTYTRLLGGSEHVSLERIYGNLPCVST